MNKPLTIILIVILILFIAGLMLNQAPRGPDTYCKSAFRETLNCPEKYCELKCAGEGSIEQGCITDCFRKSEE